MPAALLVVLLLLVLLAGAGVSIVASTAESKRLALLQPQVAAAVVRLQRSLEESGIKTYVGSTLRTDLEQQSAHDAGASATLDSWHEVGRAVDLYVYGPDGKVDRAGEHINLYRAMHDKAKRFGFRGIAFNADGSPRYINTAKGKVWDGGHLEYREGMTFAAAAAQFRALKGLA